MKFAAKLNPATIKVADADATKNTIKLVNAAGDDAIALAELDSTGKVVTLELASGKELGNKDANYVLNVNGVKDVNDNEIKDYSKVYILSDKERPSIGDVKFADTNTIEFAVSADIDSTTIASNVKVYDPHGVEVSGLTPAYVAAKDKVTIDISTLTETGKYTLRAVGLKDLAGNLINPNPTEKTFTISEDKVAPEVVAIENLGFDGTNGVIKVEFSEKIKADPVGDNSISYFTVEVDGTSATTPTITADADGKTFTVKFAGTDVNSEGLYKIAIKGYKDLADNAGKDKVQYVTVKALAPEVANVSYGTYSTGNKVVVKFDGDIEEGTLADIDATYITSEFVEGNVTIKTGALSVVDLDNDDVKEFVIDANNYTADADNAVALPGGKYTATIPAGLVKDVAGQPNKATKITFNVPEVPAADQVKVDASTNAPTQQTDVNDIIVTFTDKVDAATALNTNNYTIEGNKVFEKAVFTSTDKKVVKLTMKDSVIKEDGVYTLAISGIKDAKGNAVKAYSDEITLKENEKPYMVKAEVVAKNKVEVTFNETLAGNIDEEDFVVKVNGKELTAADITSVTATTNTVTITLANDLTSTNDVVVIVTSDDFDGADTNGNVGVTGQSITAKWVLE